MSVLVHVCRDCGHQSAWHEPRHAGYTSCRCCRAGTPNAGSDPVLQETFGLPGWFPEPLYRPGSTRNPASMHATTCCDCATCHAAYDGLADRAQ